MDNTQFDIDEIFDYLRPSVIDVSSESGEEFIVEAGNVQELDEMFRVGGPSTEAMSAFAGAAATLFQSHSLPQQSQDVTDTSGSHIETQLIELIDEHQSHQSISPTSFIDTEFEESPESSDDQGMENSFPVNSYGRPSVAILPNPRGRSRDRGLVSRPMPTYPPGFSSRSSIFNVIGEKMQEIQMDNFNNKYIDTQNEPTITNPTMPTVKITDTAPLMLHIPPIMPNFATVQGGHPVQTLTQQVFSVQTTHSTSVLLLPATERKLYKLSPTVMPNVAGFCNWCGRTYNQIGLEMLGESLLATAYDAETVRDRKVRSWAFIDGFEVQECSTVATQELR